MALVKAVRQAAPTHIPGQNFLFLWGGQTVLGLNLFQSADSSYIGGVLLAAGSMTQIRVCDVEAAALVCGDFRVQGCKSDALPVGAFRRQRGWFFFFRL